MAAMAAAAPPAVPTALLVGGRGSGKTSFINLVAKNTVRAPSTEFVPGPIDYDIQENTVCYLGHEQHLFVRFLECPGFTGDADTDSTIMNICWSTYIAVQNSCASILVFVPFADQFTSALRDLLQRLLPFLRLCSGRKVIFVISKVDTAPQYDKALTVVGPQILAYLRAQQLPQLLVDFLPIGTASVNVPSLRPRIVKSLIQLGTSLRVLPAPPPPLAAAIPAIVVRNILKHAREEAKVDDGDAAVPPAAKQARVSAAAAMDT